MISYIFTLFLLLSILVWGKSNAQRINPAKSTQPLNQGELNHVLNSAFSKLVSGNANPGEVANYASLDPIAATLNLKGTFPIRISVKKPDPSSTFENRLSNNPRYISYLSFSISGSLVDKNYGVLFSNSSLNSGVSLNAQYHFKLWRSRYSFFLDEWNDYKLKRDLLLRSYSNSRIVIEKNINHNSLTRSRYLLQLQQTSRNSKLQKNQNQIEDYQRIIDLLGTGIQNRAGLLDSMQVLIKENTSLETEIESISASVDSIDRVVSHLADSRTLLLTNQQTKLKKDFDTLLSHVNLQAVKMSWFTLLGGYSRKSYTTFDNSLPFNSQIGKSKLNDFNCGVAFNYLYQNRLKRRTIFLNTSVTRLRTNNLASLSTTTIEQERIIVNSFGDTTRKISNKYSAYTDPVESTMAWNFSLHTYYIFSKIPMGFHVFPTLDIQDNDHNIAYLTLGYIIAFRNTVKDQPAVNTEIYIRFNDLFDDSHVKEPFHRRNEIGVSFAIPFNIF